MLTNSRTSTSNVNEDFIGSSPLLVGTLLGAEKSQDERWTAVRVRVSTHMYG
jgi:hypothetical protein